MASRFIWSAQGWFGSLAGASLWLALLAGVVWHGGDGTAAIVCAGGFMLVVSVGVGLWFLRDRCSAFAGYQALLGTLAVVTAVVVVVLRARGTIVSAPWAGLAPTQLPWWMIAVAPALMLMFYVAERLSRRQ